MRNQLLKVIDMGHGLVVKLLIQQRVFLLKCLDLCLSLSLTVGNWDHHHKIGHEGRKSDVVS